MPQLSLTYGNFARFDGRILPIPETTPTQFEEIALNPRVLQSLHKAAIELDKHSNFWSEYLNPTIFVAQLIGRAAEYVTLLDTGRDRGIVEDPQLIHGVTHQYWERITHLGLQPVINTTIEPWSTLGIAPSPDFTLLGMRFLRR